MDKDYGELGEALSKLWAREPVVHWNAIEGFDKIMKTAFSSFDNVLTRKRRAVVPKLEVNRKAQDYILQEDKTPTEHYTETESHLDLKQFGVDEGDTIQF